MERKYKIKAYVIYTNKKLTCLMQAADVFSKNKFIAKPDNILIQGRVREAWEGFEHMMKKLLTVPMENFDILFFHAFQMSFDDGEIIVNTKIPPLFNPSVQCVSDGKTWTMFSELITDVIGEHFIVEENENRTIKDIKSKYIL